MWRYRWHPAPWRRRCTAAVRRSALPQLCTPRTRSQPADQHESPENQEPIEAEHELGDLLRQARFKQTQFNQNESQDAADHMGIGAGYESAAAVGAGAGKSR